MITWLGETVLPYHQNVDLLLEKVYKHFRHLQIEPPTPGETEKLVRSARRTYETQVCQTIYAQLSEKIRAALDALLKPDLALKPDSSRTLLQQVRTISGKTDLEIVLQTARYLEKLKQIDLPANLFRKVSPKLVEQYRQRTAVETPTALERHPDPIKYTLLAAFSHLRQREITDDLVDRLLQIVHKMGATAEKRVYKELLADLKRVTGKTNLLFMIAEAALDNPAGQVQEVIYPIANEETLDALVKEYRSSGPAYRLKIERTMRRSYSRHYRRMMPVLLNGLVFRTNNKVNHPLLDALHLLRTYPESSPAYDPVDETVPLEGIVPPHLHELVVKTNQKGVERVNRINYELCVWRALRERLRNKSIWVVGANRYRNPDEDLPADFETHRTQYYEDLKQPLDADTFTDHLQQQMRDALTTLDKAMPSNPSVTILSKQGGWIQVGKLQAQKPAPHLDYLKADIDRLWPMTSLLDILKETEFRVQFTDFFTSVSRREVLQRDTLQKRLLLCLYGLGTNTGLKRVSNATQATDEREKHEDLRYVFQRYIHKDALREAIGAIVNETWRIRQTHIWGEATTACASDARKFTAWDQNLVTEWHQRYHGRGVMIYWHVERNSACIHSQLKSCSSSEVAAMIEGVMRHCTEMEVEKNYVDTHGQSEIGFAFCHLLGFQLLPRLKGIHRKRLYRPDKGKPEAYPNLQQILTRPINWPLIRDHYDDMIQYATALRLGTAEADTILKRFSRNKPQHPTYRALAELGKVVRTIFLCNYLASEDLRREIHEALNVIESWNSANDFIFFGKGNEFATNRPAVQELSALSLHLLQASLVYINTLMIQRVLAQPDRLAQMTSADWRALTPLIYHHINPYGVFSLDMTQRLAL